MIIQKQIHVTISSSNVNQYESLGYSIPKYIDKKNRLKIKRGTTIQVKVSDLPKSSHYKISYVCDKCGHEGKTSFQNIPKTGKHLCYKCGFHSKEAVLKRQIALSKRIIKEETITKLRKNAHWKGVTGKNHPAYNHNLTDEDRLKNRYISGDSNWTSSVKRKSDYTCQCCGYVGKPKDGSLHSHHLNNKFNFKEQRIDIENGISLCKECHKLIHKKFGMFTTNKDFIEFKKMFSQ